MGENLDYGEFSKEIEFSREEFKEFLQKMAEKVDTGKIICEFKEREIYVDFEEPIKLKAWYKGSSEKETLKIEIEIKGKILPDVPSFQ